MIYVDDGFIPSVEVIVSSNVTERDSSYDKLRLNTTPKFMNGFKTKGKLSIAAIALRNLETDQTTDIANFRFADGEKYVTIDREKTIEFDIVKDLRISNENSVAHEVHFTMIFKESHTGKEVIFDI